MLELTKADCLGLWEFFFFLMFTLYPGSNSLLRITLEGRESDLFAGNKNSPQVSGLPHDRGRKVGLYCSRLAS